MALYRKILLHCCAMEYRSRMEALPEKAALWRGHTNQQIPKMRRNSADDILSNLLRISFNISKHLLHLPSSIGKSEIVFIINTFKFSMTCLICNHSTGIAHRLIEDEAHHAYLHLLLCDDISASASFNTLFFSYILQVRHDITNMDTVKIVYLTAR